MALTDPWSGEDDNTGYDYYRTPSGNTWRPGAEALRRRTRAACEAHLSPGRDHSEGTTADDPGWRAAAEAYLQGLGDSGNFPNLAAFGAAGLLHRKYDELTFETGLDWLLNGIAADA